MNDETFAFFAGLLVGTVAGMFLVIGWAIVDHRRRIRRAALEARYYLRTNGRSPNRNRSRPGPLYGA